MTFDPRTYWPGLGFALDTHGDTIEHRRQEQTVSRVLRRLGKVDSVLDVGCGRGRMAALLHKVLPEADYTGLDIGERQIEATKAVRPDGDFILGAVQDCTFNRRWDLVLTSEVLMHIPPHEVGGVVDKLRSVSRYLLAVEWAPSPAEMSRPIAEHNWPHDYLSLLGPAIYAEHTDRQVIYVVESIV